MSREARDHVGPEFLVVRLGCGLVGEREEDGAGAVGGAASVVAPLGARRRMVGDVGAVGFAAADGSHARGAAVVAPEADGEGSLWRAYGADDSGKPGRERTAPGAKRGRLDDVH